MVVYSSIVLRGIITWIVWCSCIRTPVHGQSFGIYFGQTATRSSQYNQMSLLAGKIRSNATNGFLDHERMTKSSSSKPSKSTPTPLFSILHQTLQHLFEWIFSYFTFVTSKNHVQEKKGNELPSLYDFVNPTTSPRSTTIIRPVYLHAPLGRNASQTSWSHSYGKQFVQSPLLWYPQSLCGRPFFSIAQSPYESYVYNIPLSHGRPFLRSHPRSAFSHIPYLLLLIANDFPPIHPLVPLYTLLHDLMM